MKCAVYKSIYIYIVQPAIYYHYNYILQQLNQNITVGIKKTGTYNNIS
jgi:histone deacetylase complex regulatory component SIN3